MPATEDAARWFDEARFGMFVHWGHISTKGLELSWPLVGGVPVLPYSTDVPVADYYADATAFSPEPGAAHLWCEAAAKCGMRYAVLTTKHHDGFALWPSEVNDFSIAATPYDGDLVGEYVEACRASGLRVGFYYSLSDWHHPDYPAFTESDKPYVSFLGKRASPDAWDRYLEVMFGQVRELLTRYGTIDVIWFDGQWERTPDEWRTSELVAMIRELQPEILINDRLPGAGDYVTPEQSLPPQPPDGRWETCMTMNRTWGYCPADSEYKSRHELVHTLCETAGRGGNFLLNVSPRGDGSLPLEQIERLDAFALWMDRHGDAIHGTTAGLEPWQFYGPSTRSGSRVFLVCVMRPYGSVAARGIRLRSIRGARTLGTGVSLNYTTRATAEQELTGDPVGEVRIVVPDDAVDPVATVIELDLDV